MHGQPGLCPAISRNTGSSSISCAIVSCRASIRRVNACNGRRLELDVRGEPVERCAKPLLNWKPSGSCTANRYRLVCQQMHREGGSFPLAGPCWGRSASRAQSTRPRSDRGAPWMSQSACGFRPEKPVVHIARQRLCDGRIVAYTVRYLPRALCPTILDEDLTVHSVHDLLVRKLRATAVARRARDRSPPADCG